MSKILSSTERNVLHLNGHISIKLRFLVDEAKELVHALHVHHNADVGGKETAHRAGAFVAVLANRSAAQELLHYVDAPDEVGAWIGVEPVILNERGHTAVSLILMWEWIFLVWLDVRLHFIEEVRQISVVHFAFCKCYVVLVILYTTKSKFSWGRGLTVLESRESSVNDLHL